MKLNISDIDLIFSYWIFVWYLLYEFKIINNSPKLALIIGLITNTILLLLMIYYVNNIYNILKVILFNNQIFRKLISLYRLNPFLISLI